MRCVFLEVDDIEEQSSWGYVFQSIHSTEFTGAANQQGFASGKCTQGLPYYPHADYQDYQRLQEGKKSKYYIFSQN